MNGVIGVTLGLVALASLLRGAVTGAVRWYWITAFAWPVALGLLLQEMGSRL